MIVTFDGVNLPEPKITPQIKPVVTKSRLVSGKQKLTPSTQNPKAWQIACICTTAEYSAILAKLGGKKSLVIGSTTHTNCCITGWRDEEINPNTLKATITFEEDTT